MWRPKYNNSGTQSDSIKKKREICQSMDANPTLRYSNTIEPRLSIHFGLFTEES